MKLSRVSIDRPKSTVILFLSIVLFGAIAFFRGKMDLFPEIEYPAITVITTLENKTPQEMRNLVTVPLEEMLSTLSGLRNVESVSRYGESVITLYFDWGRKMDDIYMETREKLDFAKTVLPQGTSRPVAMQFDPNHEAVVTLAMKSSSNDTRVMDRGFARRTILPLLEKIDGVAFVEMVGGFEKEVCVQVKLERLYANQIGIDDLLKTIQENSIEYPVGSVEEGNREYTVRVEGRLDQALRLQDLVVGRNEEGTPIYLREVADISEEDKERTVQFRKDGAESLALRLYKEGDANIVQTAREIRARLPEIEKKLGSTIRFEVLNDASKYIENSVSDIVSSALIGMVLAFIVLLLFLEEWLTAAIVALAIPVSILMTLFGMYLMNISLNLISLTGLSIGIGMMVDSNIVVIENIKKRKAMGLAGGLAAAVDEVFVPNLTSILTNVAVFLPIVFVQGIASAVFRELAIVVTFSLLGSLFTSLSLTPALYSLFYERLGHSRIPERWSLMRFYPSLESAYVKMLKPLLADTGKPLMVLGVLTVISAGLFFGLKKEVMPPLKSSAMTVTFRFDPNQSMEETSRRLRAAEAFLSNTSTVLRYSLTVGNDSPLELYSHSRKDNLATLKLQLKPGVNVEKAKRKIKRALLLLYPEGSGIGFPEEKSAFSSLLESKNRILLLGTPHQLLRDIAVVMDQRLERAGVSNHTLMLEEVETIGIEFDRPLLNQMGVSTRLVGDTAELAMNGKIATRLLTSESQEEDVRIRVNRIDLTNREGLERLLFKLSGGELVPLSDLATVKSERTLQEIKRYNRQDMVSIEFDAPPEKMNALTRSLKSVPLPKGVRRVLSWDTEDTKNTMMGLSLAFFLSAVVIYVIVAFQFESAAKPLLIMATIPLVFIGVTPVLFLTGNTVNIISLLGMILLAGIVVNNGIMLIDFYENARKKNPFPEQLKTIVLEGSVRRLRPIVMSALVTIIAFLPLIVFPGEGMEFQRILSITIGSGFLFSTAITLLMVPVLYYRIYGGKKR